MEPDKRSTSVKESTIPIIPKPHPKREIFFQVATFALVVFIAFKILELENTLGNSKIGSFGKNAH